jgi:hypothetical protein
MQPKAGSIVSQIPISPSAGNPRIKANKSYTAIAKLVRLGIIVVEVAF